MRKVLIYTLNKTLHPLFFTGRKLRLLGIGIGATGGNVLSILSQTIPITITST